MSKHRESIGLFVEGFAERFEITETLNGFIYEENEFPVEVSFYLLDEDGGVLPNDESDNMAVYILAVVESNGRRTSESFEIESKGIFSKDLVKFLIDELELVIPNDEAEEQNRLIRESELARKIQELPTLEELMKEYE